MASSSPLPVKRLEAPDRSIAAAGMDSRETRTSRASRNLYDRYRTDLRNPRREIQQWTREECLPRNKQREREWNILFSFAKRFSSSSRVRPQFVLFVSANLRSTRNIYFARMQRVFRNRNSPVFLIPPAAEKYKITTVVTFPGFLFHLSRYAKYEASRAIVPSHRRHLLRRFA